MTALVNIKGVNLTVLDATPATGYVGVPTLAAGEGAPARVKVIEDGVKFPTSASGNNYAGSTFRFLRFPTTAKIKKLEIWSDGIIDNTATTPVMVFSLGVWFSDSLTDGTPAGVRGLVPNVSGLGTTVAAPTTTGMNDQFGSVAVSASPTIPIALQDVTFTANMPATGGVVTGYAGLTNYGTPTVSGAPSQLTFVETPLINLLGFESSTGVPWAAAGFFDLYARITTAATTPLAGTLMAKLTYAE
jgi:hypothetical protein